MNYANMGTVVFPDFRGLNINMMPFVMGRPDSIPSELHGYLDLVAACDVSEREIGRVGYLTIDERFVPEGTHRREGVHTEGYGRVSWGGGAWGGSGGLYVANTVEDSCILYDAMVENCGSYGEVDMDFLEDINAIKMPASTLFWLHDRTPHASLPVENTNRQFFRLVTSEVSVWFSQHSTPNPLGVKPGAQISDRNKFD